MSRGCHRTFEMLLDGGSNRHPCTRAPNFLLQFSLTLSVYYYRQTIRLWCYYARGPRKRRRRQQTLNKRDSEI